jgi:predicted  nucleic acid-binding Zn-ribbon protein
MARSKRSIWKARTAGWWEYHPVDGPIKVNLKDPRVVKAKKEKLDFILGDDITTIIDPAQAAEIERLTKELEDAEGLAEEAKAENESLKQLLEAARTAAAADAAEVTRLQWEVMSLNDKLRIKNGKVIELDALLAVANATTASPDPRVAELEEKLSDAVYDWALVEDELRTKTNRIAELERKLPTLNGLLAARPAPAPPARRSGWSRVGWAVVLVAALAIIFWGGVEYIERYGITPDERLAAVQTELKTSNEKLAQANKLKAEEEKTLADALDAANDLTAVAFGAADSLKGDLAAANAKLNEANGKLAVVNANVESLKKGLAAAEEKKATAESERDAAKRLANEANATVEKLKADLAEATKPDDPLKLWSAFTPAKRRSIVQTTCNGRAKWADVDSQIVDKALATYDVEKARALLATCDVTQLLQDAQAFKEPEPKAETSPPPVPTKDEDVPLAGFAKPKPINKSCDRSNLSRCIKAL